MLLASLFSWGHAGPEEDYREGRAAKQMRSARFEQQVAAGSRAAGATCDSARVLLASTSVNKDYGNILVLRAISQQFD